MLKSQLRSVLLTKRINMSEEEVAAAEKKIAESLLSLDILGDCKTIMAYADFKNEVRTGILINYLLKAGKKTVLPRICRGEIVPYEIRDLNDLKKGAFGITEPDSERCAPADIKVIDAVIVPGIGFDRRGNRIGFGKGYYDRFLSKLKSQAKIIALAYDFQIVADIPPSPCDVPVHCIVTEKEIIFAG